MVNKDSVVLCNFATIKVGLNINYWVSIFTRRAKPYTRTEVIQVTNIVSLKIMKRENVNV